MSTDCKLPDIMQNGVDFIRLSNRLSELQNKASLPRTPTNMTEAVHNKHTMVIAHALNNSDSALVSPGPFPDY